MRRRWFLSLVPLLLLACGPLSSELSAAGSRVRTGKAPPHAGCRELGIVMGSGGGGGWTDTESKMTTAQNEIRNRAAELGGNFVAYDTTGSDINGVTLTGHAFRCTDTPPVRRVATIPAWGPQPTIEERLLKLDELHQKGLISDEERATRRAEILRSI